MDVENVTTERLKRLGELPKWARGEYSDQPPPNLFGNRIFKKWLDEYKLWEIEE